ncbi:tRNA1(Val) (adenine(37)-N6)-methyltransferase [Emcibacter sp.]|uniref:tRNA1(Val) (adenine(37)-N6)-methyltransferase n=1 Tax=Emcibacter sp. TaxID=1979954 RepID=UPI002AA622F3|nr:N-6 DNA methylase [Emcibacter sp.]
MTDLNDIDHTTDDFLGGIVRLHQPRRGYRVAMDTVLLAASLELKPGERVLDVGAGTGGILTCLAGRLGDDSSDLTLHGIELQPLHVLFARENAALNGFDDRIRYFEGDIVAPPETCEKNSYHHVVSNPPYYEKGMHTASPQENRALAHTGSHLSLADWISCCLKMVRPRGYLSLIQKADRLDDILSALQGKAGEVVVFPVWPDDCGDAGRVIVRTRKDSRAPLALKRGLVVHKSEGGYTDRAEAVLRHGQKLTIA